MVLALFFFFGFQRMQGQPPGRARRLGIAEPVLEQGAFRMTTAEEPAGVPKKKKKKGQVELSYWNFLFVVPWLFISDAAQRRRGHGWRTGTIKIRWFLFMSLSPSWTCAHF